MNWLAHILLSEPNVENRLGNLLGDLVKGKDLDGLDRALRRGVERHYAIDKFTDSHATVKISKRRLVNAMPILERECLNLDRDFNSFFPDLQHHIQDWKI